MKRMLARVATLTATLPLAVALAAGSASANDPITTTVPGCWGAGDAIVCDVKVTAHGAHPSFEPMWVKVCAGDCHDIPVTWADPGADAVAVCYSYKDIYGGTHGACATDAMVSIDLSDLVIDLFGCSTTRSIEGACVYQ